MPKAKKYVDVKVTEKTLDRLKREQENAIGMAKYGRFKAWLHYANLNSWQQQKWHWAYINYAGESWHCTCGLVVPMDAENEVVDVDSLNLDEAHLAKGHRRLPNFEGVVVSFIYDYKWIEDLGVYYYDAFCQECGDHVLERPGKAADLFTDLHNISCG